MYIRVHNVSKEYSHTVKALDSINLDINKGEFICLLGPSGCGKTSLLNLLAGFEKPTDGEVWIGEEKVTSPSERYVTIFQNYGLLPWRTVQRNVELGLESRGWSKKEIREVANEYLELVGLSDFRKHHPHQLSGGMQQRVAIARALAVDPEIIFMDEPFGALDAMTRIKMQDEIARIWEKRKKTIVFVTHDIDEAVFLADRIVIMTPHPGKIKTIIKVDRYGSRNRIDPSFLKVRDRVFDQFGMKD